MSKKYAERRITLLSQAMGVTVTGRPTCAHCGAAYGRRATTDAVLVWRKGEKRPGYRGNGIVIKERQHGPLFNLEKALGRPKRPDDEYVFLDIWDGQTWDGGYRPFCTLRCALDYARRAFKKHGAI